MDDGELIEPQVDYGNRAGYWVRVDVTLPRSSLDRPVQGGDGPVEGSIALSADEAEELARLLTLRAEQVRTATADLARSQDRRRGQAPAG